MFSARHAVARCRVLWRRDLAIGRLNWVDWIVRLDCPIGLSDWIVRLDCRSACCLPNPISQSNSQQFNRPIAQSPSWFRLRWVGMARLAHPPAPTCSPVFLPPLVPGTAASVPSASSAERRHPPGVRSSSQEVPVVPRRPTRKAISARSRKQRASPRPGTEDRALSHPLRRGGRGAKRRPFSPARRARGRR